MRSTAAFAVALVVAGACQSAPVQPEASQPEVPVQAEALPEIRYYMIADT